LHIANEGQFLAVVAPEYADAALNALSAAPGVRMRRLSEKSANSRAAPVLVPRVMVAADVDMLVGESLPRIC